MNHLFRPAESDVDQPLPLWKCWRGLLYVVGGQLLARAGRLFTAHRARTVAAYVALILGLAIQGALLLTAAYLVDLSVSLMELWADLARKHLELTL
jgi:hypothetical protein